MLSCHVLGRGRLGLPGDKNLLGCVVCDGDVDVIMGGVINYEKGANMTFLLAPCYHPCVVMYYFEKVSANGEMVSW
jgi:hypothetical protein